MSDDSGFDEIDWSYSKARRYEACQRAFYYQHRYAERDGSVTIEGSIESSSTAQRSLGSLVGIAVHRSISRQIDLWKRGDRMDMTTAQETVANYIRDHTETQEYTDQTSEKTPDEIISDLISIAKSHVKTFFQVIWSRFSSHRYIAHETLESFLVNQHHVWVRPDLCTRDQEGRLIVTDWKTSAPETYTKDKLQLSVYALWAHQQFEPDLTKIRAQFAFTSDGQIHTVRFDDKDLQVLRGRIIADCLEWNEKSDMSEFPTSPAVKRCQRCPYLDKCTDGQKVVSSL